MKQSVSLPAYAKVNLHLAVLGKRPDGYHELNTLFERVSLCDDVTLERSASGQGIELECDFPEVPKDATNLAVRAAILYQEKSNWKEPIRIKLIKRVPAGGGMGGGSSDAAAVLVGLGELTGGILPKHKVVECARALGADVAFFVEQTSFGLGTERGDQIEPIACKAKLWHLLVTPDFPIATRSIYDGLRLTAPAPDVRLLLRALDTGEYQKVREFLFNALEPTVETLYPAIREVKAGVEKSGGLARPCVSGSGSTVFAVCASESAAFAAQERLAKEYPAWRIFAASTA